MIGEVNSSDKSFPAIHILVPYANKTTSFLITLMKEIGYSVS
jgi:hypothetical protein